MLCTHLENLQFLQPLLHQLLHPSAVRLYAVLSERIPSPPLCVLAEIVGGKLARRAQEGAIERADLEGRGT